MKNKIGVVVIIPSQLNRRIIPSHRIIIPVPIAGPVIFLSCAPILLSPCYSIITTCDRRVFVSMCLSISPLELLTTIGE